MENLNGLTGIELVEAVKAILPKGKNIGYPSYISINERLKSVRVSYTSVRWAKNAEKVFKKLGYSTDLDCRENGTILI